MDGHHPHAFGPLLDDRRFVDLSALGILLDAFDECAERGCASLEVPRHVDQPLTVRERLLAGRPEGDAGMGADGLEQHGDGLGDGPAVAPHVEPAQQLQRVGDLGARGIKCCAVDGSHRIQVPDRERAVAIDLLPKREQRLVAQREERAAQRRKDLELVIGPLDRRERVAQRDDLFAIMERTPTDQDVGYAPRLERADVRPRDVGAEIPEAAEEKAICRGRIGTGLRSSSTVQPLSLTSQSTKAPTASGNDSSMRAVDDLAEVAIRLRHRQRDDRRRPATSGRDRLERHIPASPPHRPRSRARTRR